MGHDVDLGAQICPNGQQYVAYFMYVLLGSASCVSVRANSGTVHIMPHRDICLTSAVALVSHSFESLTPTGRCGAPLA